MLAYCLALSSSVAIGDTSEMNVGICVCSCEINEGSAAATEVSAVSLGFAEAAPGITLNRTIFTLTMSKKIPKRFKNALRKEPPTTLPQFLQSNLFTGREHSVLCLLF